MRLKKVILGAGAIWCILGAALYASEATAPEPSEKDVRLQGLVACFVEHSHAYWTARRVSLFSARMMSEGPAVDFHSSELRGAQKAVLDAVADSCGRKCAIRLAFIALACGGVDIDEKLRLKESIAASASASAVAVFLREEWRRQLLYVATKDLVEQIFKSKTDSDAVPEIGDVLETLDNYHVWVQWHFGLLVRRELGKVSVNIMNAVWRVCSPLGEAIEEFFMRLSLEKVACEGSVPMQMFSVGHVRRAMKRAFDEAFVYDTEHA